MIITKEKYKKLNNITDDSKDEILDVLIPLVEQDYLFIRNKPFDTDAHGFVIYPFNSELVANDMLNYRFKTNGSTVYSSETIGDYSYTINFFDGSYPKSILKRIKRFVGVK